MKIKGEGIYIVDLKLEHVYLMRSWGYHENPLLIGYNFPIYTDREIRKWYDIKNKTLFNKYFAVFTDNDIFIGYIGIKNISRILRRSTLGIVFDPNYINKGYGTEGLDIFLDYYFTKMKMRNMYLDVDLFNKRAFTVYKKLGFKVTGKYLGKFAEDVIDLNSSYYLENKNDFVIKNNKIYNYRYNMKLSKEDYLNIKRNNK